MKYLNIAMLAVLLPFASTFAANGPCKQSKAQIISACESAGFVKGGHKTGKGLYKDCVKPIEGGQTVAGVTVDQNLLTACKEKKASKGTAGVPVTPVSTSVKTGS